MPAFTTRKESRYACDVTCSARRHARALQRPAVESDGQSDGAGVEGDHQTSAIDRPRPGRTRRVPALHNAWTEGNRRKGRDMSHVVMKSGELARLHANERVNHWITVILFVLLAASGLAFFHPGVLVPVACLAEAPGRASCIRSGCADVRLVRAAALRYWGDKPDRGARPRVDETRRRLHQQP